MWAILDYDNETVIGVVLPTATEAEAKAENPDRTLIKVTLENSPAYYYGKWDGKRFCPPSERIK